MQNNKREKDIPFLKFPGVVRPKSDNSSIEVKLMYSFGGRVLTEEIAVLGVESVLGLF
jgi:hypothetical protein